MVALSRRAFSCTNNVSLDVLVQFHKYFSGPSLVVCLVTSPYYSVMNPFTLPDAMLGQRCRLPDNKPMLKKVNIPSDSRECSTKYVKNHGTPWLHSGASQPTRLAGFVPTLIALVSSAALKVIDKVISLLPLPLAL